MAAVGHNGGGDARTEQEGQSDRPSEPSVSSAEHEQAHSRGGMVAADLAGGGNARTEQGGQSDKPS